MGQHIGSPARVIQGPPPLTIPEELWSTLSSDQRTVYAHAQRILDGLRPGPSLTLLDVTRRTGLPVEAALIALRALDALDLVSITTDGRDVLVRLIALPDAHVPVTRPDGSHRWLFVSRPVTPPDVHPSQLN